MFENLFIGFASLLLALGMTATSGLDFSDQLSTETVSVTVDVPCSQGKVFAQSASVGMIP